MPTSRAFAAIKNRMAGYTRVPAARILWREEGGGRPEGLAPWLLVTVDFGIETTTIGKLNGKRRRERPGVVQVLALVPKRDGAVAAWPLAETAKNLFDHAGLTTAMEDELIKFDTASVINHDGIARDLLDTYAVALMTATFAFTYYK